jgi:hypothetical protein
MAVNSQSVYSLIATIRQRSDMGNSATFDDLVELVPWVRQSLAQMHEILVSRWVDYYTIKRPLTIQANVERYTLPSNFRAMNAVYLLFQSGGYKQQLRGMSRAEMGKYGNNLSPTCPFGFCIEANKLYLGPRPSQTYVNAIELHYTPQYRGPLLDWTTIDSELPNGWEEWVVLDVIQKMKTKINQNTDDVLRLKQDVQARVIAAAAIRNSEPPQMRDIFETNTFTWYNGSPGGLQTWAG